MKQKSCRLIIFQTSCALLLSLGFICQTQAALIVSHNGDTDPLTEGFRLWPFNDSTLTAPLANDNGHAAWHIDNTGSVQSVYSTDAGLTVSQISDIQMNGFSLSVLARVLDGPVYDINGTQEVSAAISVAGFTNARFDIGLGRDGLGNTLVILPDFITGTTPWGMSDYNNVPLLVSGNDYHLYQLLYNPITLDAEFYLDGTLMGTGYAGSEHGHISNYGLIFGTVNGGAANYALAQLDSGIIPIPGAIILFVSGLVSIVGLTWWRRK